jgi:hypothetical protein
MVCVKKAKKHKLNETGQAGVLRVPGSLVNFQIREWNGAFGPAARVGEMAGERTEQKAEWSGGFRNSSREPHRATQVLACLAA